MMKHVIALLLGIVTGVCLLFVGLYYNPMVSNNKLSPLSVTDNDVIALNYSTVGQDALVYTNDGESPVVPHPVKVLQLWEPPIRQTWARATELANARGELAGIGIKFSSKSESSSILDGRANVDSAWHIYLPDRGTLYIQQTENYWGYIRDVVVPARWSSGDNWRGTWRGNITSGPGALGTAYVYGGTGMLGDVDTEAVEALNARAYSVDKGPVAANGELTIEIPGHDTSAVVSE